MNNFLEEFIKEKYGSNVGSALDFGAGKGVDVRELQKIGWDVKGLDLPSNDLNFPYKTDKQVDFIYSIAVIQFIKDKEVFVRNIIDNLKDDGWFFILTFSKNDVFFGEKGGMSKEDLEGLFKEFKNVKTENKDFFDNDIGHNHWHKLLIVTGQKRGE